MAIGTEKAQRPYPARISARPVAGSRCGASVPALAAATPAATSGRSQTAVMRSKLWLWRVNIRKGTARPQATASRASRIQRPRATSIAAPPISPGPKKTKPLTMVARPMGIVPRNIDITGWAKTRRASAGKSSQRAP